MKSKVLHTYNHPLDVIADLYTSREFIEGPFKQSSTEYVICEEVEKEGYIRMRIERQVSMKSGSIPGPMKKMLGSEGKFITLTEFDASSTGCVKGRTEFSIEGVPVGFIVRTTLRADGDNTREESLIEITARIPVMGKKIEKMMLPQAEKAVEKNYRRTCEALQK